MKKVFSIILIIIMLLSLCACRKKDDSASNPTDISAATGGTEATSDNTATTTSTSATNAVIPTTAPTNTPTTAPTTTPTQGPTTPAACSHTYKDATCVAPKTCTKCGATEGSVGSHKFQNGACSVCGAADSINPKENIEEGLDYVGRFREADQTAPALMFSGDGCAVTTRYFTTNPEEASSGGWDYNGKYYYSVGGGFTPYRYQMTDTEIIVTTVYYEEDNGNVTLKAIMLSNGDLKITYSTREDFPVGEILFANIENIFK